jgi:hypothetical protein
MLENGNKTMLSAVTISIQHYPKGLASAIREKQIHIGMSQVVLSLLKRKHMPIIRVNIISEFKLQDLRSTGNIQ